MTKILVIEDEDHIRNELMDWLQFEGYVVTGAADGRQGLENALAEAPDLILCDIFMPEMDGRQVLLEVRSHPSLNRTPFIFLTADSSRESVRAGMELGADDYITKPFTLDEVLRAVRARLEQRATQDALQQSHLDLLTAELEHERERRMLKSRLVAMFSHDFRNPLTAILSSVELLRAYDGRISPERKETYLDRMEGSVRLLLQMLDDMLIVAQMETEDVRYVPELLDISDLTRAIVDEFEAIHAATHRFRYAGSMDAHLTVDPILFRRIVANLISNAVKYSPAGTQVSVTIEETAAGVALAVEDQGIGIPEAEIPRLFEPFQRAANVKEVKGTGLGLSIVKQAVELCGGTIQVKSVVGKGSWFVVELPRTREESCELKQ